MSSYQRVPSSSPPPSLHSTSQQPPQTSSSSSSRLSTHRPQEQSTRDAFDPPAPAIWKRVALVLGILAMFWLALRLGRGQNKRPQVIYATRYSDEHRYRPAASPIITEHLPDGRIRLRGASPAGVGIRPGDLPKTPRELEKERKDREEVALEEAKKMLGIKGRKRKGKRNKGADEI